MQTPKDIIWDGINDNLFAHSELGEFFRLFQPIYARRLRKTRLHNMRFAYYTSASTGLNILKGRALWMRAAACMNDYREIDYGIQLLNHTIYGSDYRRSRVKELAENLGWGSGTVDQMLSDLNRNEQQYVTHTYLACVAEHRPQERGKGRLSMWRAYGRKTGIAIVLKPSAIFFPIEPLPLLLTPVEYLTQNQFTNGFDWMLDNLNRNLMELKAYEPKKMLDYFVHMLLASIFSIKNPGFSEEKEWRFLYHETNNTHLHHDIVVVDGVPQIIYKLPICGPKDQGPGVPLDEALDEIIIGPSQFAEVIRTAFIRALMEMGIHNAEQRVSKSNIPLR